MHKFIDGDFTYDADGNIDGFLIHPQVFADFVDAAAHPAINCIHDCRKCVFTNYGKTYPCNECANLDAEETTCYYVEADEDGK